MWSIVKTFAPRALQDVITGLASILAAHGYITANQEQGFIGSAFFLAMLVVNYVIAQSRKTVAVQAGAAATGNYLSTADASAIAKGKTP